MASEVRVKVIGTTLLWIADIAERALSVISEERCRLCHVLLGIAHEVFESDDDELARYAPALLHTLSPGSERIWFSRTLCQSCWNELCDATPLIGFCPVGDGEESYSLAVASGAVYSGKVRKLIHRLKFNGDQALARDVAALAFASWPLLSSRIQDSPISLVPVPLHWRRRMERGFNQSELIARMLAHRLNCRVVPGALKRVKATGLQQKLSQQARHNNVAHAFVANPRLVQGRAIVLVDDVCTSGATLSECARELLSKGAASVAALTVARAIMRGRSTQENGGDEKK